MRFYVVILSFLIGGWGLYADSSPVCRIAAVVNKSIITQADLMNRLRFVALTSGLEPNVQNLEKIKPQMLRMMIDEKLQLAAGEEAKIPISDTDVQDAIKRLEEVNGMPKGYIAQLMTDNHIPLKTLEDQVKANLIWVEYVREKYSPTLQIAEAEVERELAMHKEKETKTQYHLAEIVLPFEDAEQEERAKNDLSRLIEELQKGAQFSALAQQFSQSGTASLGGDMGWLTEDQLMPDIKEVVAHMEPGQLSQPIRTPQAYTIIGYIEKKLPEAQKTAEFSDNQARNLIAERKLSLSSSRELRDLRRHAFIEIRM